MKPHKHKYKLVMDELLAITERIGQCKEKLDKIEAGWRNGKTKLEKRKFDYVYMETMSEGMYLKGRASALKELVATPTEAPDYVG